MIMSSAGITVDPMTGDKRGAALTWRFGDHSLTALSDGYFETPMSEVVTRIGLHTASDAQRAALRPDPPRISHTMYLLQGPAAPPTLIDVGMGDGRGDTMGQLPASLALTGVSPDQIGRVLLTHLHLDHSAGLINSDGTPRFPHAEVVLHRDEADYWLDPARADAANPQDRSWFDGARAAMEPYRDRMRTFDGVEELAPGVATEPLQGHTPGHSGYRLTADDLSVLLWGDIVHLPGIQAPHPEASVVFDIDGEAAATTRQQVLEAAAAQQFLVAGGHTEFPGVARVRRRHYALGYEVVPELWVRH